MNDGEEQRPDAIPASGNAESPDESPGAHEYLAKKLQFGGIAVELTVDGGIKFESITGDFVEFEPVVTGGDRFLPIQGEAAVFEPAPGGGVVFEPGGSAQVDFKSVEFGAFQIEALSSGEISFRPTTGGGIQLEPGQRSGFWEASIAGDLQPGLRLNEKTESPPPIYGPE
jgi:hypothetical protein